MYLLRRKNQNSEKTEEKNRKPLQCSVYMEVHKSSPQFPQTFWLLEKYFYLIRQICKTKIYEK